APDPAEPFDALDLHLQAGHSSLTKSSQVPPSHETVSQLTLSQLTDSQVTPSQVTPSHVTPSQVTPSHDTPCTVSWCERARIARSSFDGRRPTLTAAGARVSAFGASIAPAADPAIIRVLATIAPLIFVG